MLLLLLFVVAVCSRSGCGSGCGSDCGSGSDSGSRSRFHSRLFFHDF